MCFHEFKPQRHKGHKDGNPSNRRLLVFFVSFVSLWFVVLGRSEWYNNFAATDPFHTVFWKLTPMPRGTALTRKTPAETRPALAARLDLRALEAERALDITAAEQDWKQRPPIELADFYHRRNRPADEIQALAAAGRQPAPPSENLTPAAQQASWHAFERIFVLIDAQALPPATAGPQYQAWMARYPKEPSIPARYFDFLLKQKQFTAAAALIASYQRGFPDDRVFPMTARASLAEARGNTGGALAAYDQAFDPLWPEALQAGYYALLNQHRGLRDFLSRARAAGEANPEDIAPAGRIFFYYARQANNAAARRALLEYRIRKEARHTAWKPAELRTLARLLESVKDYVEAARAWKSLSEIPNDAAAAEDGIAGLCSVLLTAPEQPIAFGMDDLTFLRDVATIDPYPGFLNGIFSLLLNRSNPAVQYSSLEREHSTAYFHRAAAAELLGQLDKRFPRAARRAELRAALVEAYAAYGADAGVIAAGTAYLADFPAAPQRLGVALRMAESYARTNREREEFALYDSLLKDLADRASNVPLGAGAAAPVVRQTPDGINAMEGTNGTNGARSPDYARILDRYVARLVSLRRVTEATALYRRELDHNPNDPGLYERLAAFLDQNRRTTEVEAVYSQAMSHFPDRSWHHKLARWYLRQRRIADFERLTRDVTGVFNGSDLESYFTQVVSGAQLDAVVYRQINLAAHERFPDNLVFVRGLLTAYRARGTSDPNAWQVLLRQYWTQDASLRNTWLEFLAANNHLESELQEVKALPAPSRRSPPPDSAANPAFNAPATLFTAEAEIWQGHFEAAIDPYDKLAAENPGDAAAVGRAASLHRSLSYIAGHAERAVALEESLSKLDPRDHASLTHAGEIQADRERYAAAAPYWNRIAAIEPGRGAGYLEAATVFWDYYRYDDALRLIAQGRAKLGQTALFAYEAGAIHENQRDYTAAIREYVKGALETDQESGARDRLVRLARRADLRPMIETAAAAGGASPTPAAFALRVALLKDPARRSDLESYLSALAGSSSSFDMLARVEQEAVTQGMDAVRQKAVEREIAINKDPVEDMRLRLALAGLHEGLNHTDAARAIIVALYRDHPTILGIVRATVDFHWRHNTPDGAIGILLKAADVSYPAQKRAFVFEAARKCTTAKQFPRARELLAQLTAPLNKDQPFSGEYLAAIADTYSQAGDDRGLRDFYTATLTALRDAKLPADERVALTASMRRGLIPALARLKDFTGALDQYIEVLNRFPEDAALAREAAAFAARNNLKPRLLDYYTKTAATSPRDFHWPLVLARLQTQFEDFPTAINAYGTALVIRPDRADLLESRAGLEERLLRFPEVLADYQKLYELSYHDPKWMEKTAEADARLGKTQDSIAALRKAFIENRPDKGENYYKVADRLIQWNLTEEALPFAQQGKEKSVGDNGRYLNLLMQVRRFDQALTQLLAVPEDAQNGALQQSLGATVARYYTPEEKAAFAAAVDKQPPAQRHQLLFLAAAAGIPDLHARLLNQELMAMNKPQERSSYLSQFVELQNSRMKYGESGAQLEAYWNAYPGTAEKDYILDLAIAAYHATGDDTQELRLLQTRYSRTGIAGAQLDRYLTLLYARDPRQLLELARVGRGTDARNAATAKILEHGDAQLTRDAMQARGSGISPVWTRAYTGLGGLYLADASPPVNEAFVAALDSGNIGQRLGKRLDRREQLAGDIWFYYGSRYGEYLDLLKKPNAEDYLPSAIEGKPASAGNFVTLADYYAEKNNATAALGDYDHALELDRTLVSPYTGAATVLWKQGRRDEAIARWKLALAACEKDGNNPQRAGQELNRTLESLKQSSAYASVAPEAERALRAYLHSNGAMIDGRAFQLAAELAGVSKAVELAASAPDQLTLLGTLVQTSGMRDSDRDPIYAKILELAQRHVAENFGEARTQAASALRQWRIQYASFLLGMHQAARAEEQIAPLRVKEPGSSPDIDALEIAAAAMSGKLEALLERYGREPDKTPEDQTLLSSAADLRKENANASRRLLEFAYSRQLELDSPAPSSFLGLAEVRLQQNNVPAALALLRRMNLVSGAPFESLLPAARLLESTGHSAEANEFLAVRLRAVPWDFEARLMSARLTRNQAALAAIGRDSHAPYDVRAQATGADPVVAALRAPDAAARLSALLEVIAASPDNSAARLAVYRAALEAQRDQLAISAIEPLVRATPQPRYQEEEGDLDQLMPPISPMIPIFHSRQKQAFLPTVSTDDAHRAALAADLARAHERLGELGQAVNFFGIAGQYDPASRWKQEQDRVSAEITRNNTNAQRRPEIKVALEQSRPVRPQIRRQP